MLNIITERNRLTGKMPDSLDSVRHTIIELNLGHNLLSPYIPVEICEENACNVCRGAGACDPQIQACSCADGATGSFCENIDQEAFAQLMFNNRKFFDTTMWAVNSTDSTGGSGSGTASTSATGTGSNSTNSG
jgi:hypothetical protein